MFCRDQLWLGKGRQDFLHSQAYSFSLNQQECMLWRLLYQTCQVQGPWRASRPQKCPAVPADPGQILMDDTAVSDSPSDYWNHSVVLNDCNGIFLYIIFWNVYLPKILYSVWIFFPYFSLTLKLVLWTFYLGSYTFKNTSYCIKYIYTGEYGWKYITKTYAKQH